MPQRKLKKRKPKKKAEPKKAGPYNKRNTKIREKIVTIHLECRCNEILHLALRRNSTGTKNTTKLKHETVKRGKRREKKKRERKRRKMKENERDPLICNKFAYTKLHIQHRKRGSFFFSKKEKEKRKPPFHSKKYSSFIPCFSSITSRLTNGIL